MKTKLFFLIFAIFIIFQIARESIGWALITSAFVFAVFCWWHKEPKYSATNAAREQRELIEKGGDKWNNQKTLSENWFCLFWSYYTLFFRLDMKTTKHKIILQAKEGSEWLEIATFDTNNRYLITKEQRTRNLPAYLFIL